MSYYILLEQDAKRDSGGELWSYVFVSLLYCNFIPCVFIKELYPPHQLLRKSVKSHLFFTVKNYFK